MSGIILDFLAGGGLAACKKRLDQLLEADDYYLEHTHNYIQWMFPLAERSRAVPESPYLADDEVASILASPHACDNVVRCLGRMCRFYGFVLEQEGSRPLIRPGPEFAARARVWCQKEDHNLRRISRILGSLVILGLAEHARALLDALEQMPLEYQRQCADAIPYWRSAACCCPT